MPRAHVRVANVQGDLVLLDLATDDYLCLSRHDAAPVWPALRAKGSDGPVLQELVAAHLMQQVPSTSTPWAASPPSTAVDMPAGVQARVRAGDVAAMAVATLKTLWDLSGRGSRRWLKAVARPAKEASVSDAAVFEIATRFQHMRCFFPRTGRCFVHSAMLRYVLESHAIGCKWVFGVQTHPFEAHCWVEARGAVLNDSAEHINWYTVIARF
ncbi:lasso peptide biosynthesis B2 protein [Sphingobium boeckii]|uniref:Microcin J25-processing protein McjB C-terminal domain-containing protein n=1 Tax=Sphingobium boeckii TaxID=1082345 RepID=A0A7W9AGH9_9SPHN|nr:lasso peptide biosynthesis B2 protein [Sphingobium boeckii]MBB5685014.1 hypothetical protein [Sphingobium boeckii]